jgi:hypothetical protein
VREIVQPLRSSDLRVDRGTDETGRYRRYACDPLPPDQVLKVTKGEDGFQTRFFYQKFENMPTAQGPKQTFFVR